MSFFTFLLLPELPLEFLQTCTSPVIIVTVTSIITVISFNFILILHHSCRILPRAITLIVPCSIPSSTKAPQVFFSSFHSLPPILVSNKNVSKPILLSSSFSQVPQMKYFHQFSPKNVSSSTFSQLLIFSQPVKIIFRILVILPFTFF